MTPGYRDEGAGRVKPGRKKSNIRGHCWSCCCWQQELDSTGSSWGVFGMTPAWVPGGWELKHLSTGSVATGWGLPWELLISPPFPAVQLHGMAKLSRASAVWGAPRKRSCVSLRLVEICQALSTQPWLRSEGRPSTCVTRCVYHCTHHSVLHFLPPLEHKQPEDRGCVTTGSPARHSVW